MKTKLKRIMALALCLCMSFSICTSALANETSGKNQKTDSYYYVGLGDSITAGVGLYREAYPETTPNDEPALRVTNNYKRTNTGAYPELVAKEIQAALPENVAFDWSNLGTAAFGVNDVIMTLQDPTYEGQFAQLNEQFQVGVNLDKNCHQIYMQELPKADLITIQIGGNDMLMGLFDPDAIPMDNPLISVLTETLSGILFGYEPMEVLARAYQSLQKNPIAINDIVELASVMDLSSLEKTMAEMPEKIMDQYGDMIKAIKKVNPDAQIVIVGNFASWGSSLEAEGVTYDEETIKAIIKKILVKAITGIEPLQEMGISETEAEQIIAGEEYGLMETSAAEDITEAELQECIEDYNAADDMNTVEVLSLAAEYDVKNPSQYGLNSLIDEIRETIRQRLLTLLTDVFDQLQYPMFYYLTQSTQGSMLYMNERLAQWAEEFDALYVDIYGIPNENNANPHPNAKGHQYIANQIVDAIIHDVTISSENGTVEGPEKIIYNRPTEFKVAANEGYCSGNVELKANNETLNESEKDTYVVTAAGDVEITATFGEHIADTEKEENHVEATVEKEGCYDKVIYCSECGAELERTHVVLETLKQEPTNSKTETTPGKHIDNAKVLKTGDESHAVWYVVMILCGVALGGVAIYRRKRC